MPCTIALADLGPAFAEVDEDAFDLWLESATAIVLGEAATRPAREARLVARGIDVCEAIKAVARHLIAAEAANGIEAGLLSSQRVGAIAETYAVATPKSPLWSGSTYGPLANLWMIRINRVLASRNTLPGMASRRL
jgi:hypothetical protein